MTSMETMRLGLPLLQPAQAQKHVTVNESLVRLDGLVNLVLQSVSRVSPPETVIEGECWGVPGGADGAWAGQTGRIAIGSNGGWIFATASAGMSAHILDRGVRAIHNGAAWVTGALNLTGNGSALLAGSAEDEVIIAAGSEFDTGITIKPGTMVIGAVARVTSAIEGTLGSWRLGTEAADDRFGSGLGTGAGSWSRGMLGTPMTYYQEAPLIMKAEGGTFAGGGTVRLTVHWWELRLPDA